MGSVWSIVHRVYSAVPGPTQNLIAQTYAVVEFAVEYLVASAAHRVSPWLARTGRRFNKVCGGFFVLFGVALPVHS